MSDSHSRCLGPACLGFAVLIGLACLPAFSPAAFAAAGLPDPVAVIGGEPITRAQLEEASEAQLHELENQRHRILEATLERLVEERLLAAEAERRGVTSAALLDELTAGSPVTDAEVDAWYDANQARIRQPKEAVAERIREYLAHQGAEQRRREALAALRKGHAVRVLLEPLRLDVASESAPSKGPEGAAVTLVEFSDFQCPFCARILPTLTELQETYGERLRVQFRQYPLPIHPQAPKASEAALCAADQESFWPMHDAIFSDQGALGIDDLKARAGSLGLDQAAFDRCLDSGEKAAQVAADLEAGRRAGVGGTPTFFVNGRLITLRGDRPPYEQLAEMIDEELARLR